MDGDRKPDERNTEILSTNEIAMRIAGPPRRPRSRDFSRRLFWLTAVSGVLMSGAALLAFRGGASPTAAPLAMPAGLFGSPTPTPVPTPKPEPPISALYTCRGRAEFHVKPEEASVYVNGQRIGTSDDWDDSGGGGTYTFPGRGTYICRFQYRGRYTKWVKVIVDPSAKDKIAKVKMKLEKR